MSSIIVKSNETSKIKSQIHLFDLNAFEKMDFIFNWKFGLVYEIISKDKKSKMNAKISKKMITDYSQEELAYLINDLNISLQLTHPSIIKIYGYSPINFNNISTPVIITERSFGNLQQYNKSKFTNTQKLIIMHGIAYGMSYLHSHNIIHRDLSPTNIFIDESFYPKISNFGFSENICEKNDNSDQQSQFISQIIGTPLYSSPETLEKLIYSKPADVYSYSMIIFELLTNEKPFNMVKNLADFYTKVIKNGERPKFTGEIRNCYRCLIEKCWSKDPSKRPNFEQIVEMLEKDEEFVKEDINIEEYQAYLTKIKSYEINFYDQKDKEKLKEEDLKNIRKINHSKQNFFNFVNIQIDSDKKINLENFENNEEIGSGNSSSIHRITEKETGNFYAAKIFSGEIDSKSIDYINKVMREVNILSFIDHPSIVKFIGFSPTDFQNEPYPVMVTEKTSNESLGKIIELSNSSLKPHSWNFTKMLINIYGIASGMSFLHSHNIIHRDLSPNNILEDENYYPKICDFGVAKIFSLNKENKIEKVSDGFVAAPNYIDPDILVGSPYSPASDVYSFGLLVYSILTNEIPFDGYSYKNIIWKASSGDRPLLEVGVPDVYKNLITKCWSSDANARPTFKEIVDELRNNKEFITDEIDENSFKDYIEYIDKYNATFCADRPVIQLNKNYNYEEENEDDDLLDDTPNKEVIEKRKEYEKFTSLKKETCDLKIFEKKGKLGEGKFGAVYKVLDKNSNFIYAAKIAKTIFNYDKPSDIINLNREVKIISQLNHPTVLRFIGYSPQNFNHVSKPVIITEYVSGGSLDEVIKQERNSQSIDGWDCTKKLINIYGIASSLAYLHSIGIIHRDLKPENVLLDKYLCPKLADFGLSKSLNEINDDVKNKSYEKGTLIYMSPEIWDINEYGKAGDVYAFAIVIYEIITNQIPYQGMNQMRLAVDINNGLRPIFKVKIPECYKCLIEECWKQDPDERPTFDEIVDLLKNDSDFITELVEGNEFLDYAYSIEEPENEQKTKKSFQKEFVRSRKKNRKKNFVHQENFLDLSKFSYNKSDVIYEGEFTKIVKIVDKQTGVFYAAKKSTIEMDELSESDSVNLSREVNILSKLNHPSIMKFIGYSPFNFKKKPKPVIVTEFLSFGSLEKVLSDPKNNADLNWNNTKKLINIYGIAHSMAYLHSNQTLHRDLKPSNILLDENLYPKLTDFGFSVKKHKECSMTYQSSIAFHNISSYSAPEVLNCGEYTKASDVYSFAMIVYQIMTNEVPFKNLKNDSQLLKEVYQNGNRPKLSKKIPECYARLIDDCWQQEQDQRLTFDQIVEILENSDEFVKNGVDENEYKKYLDIVNGYNITYSHNERLVELEDFKKNSSYSDDLDDENNDDEIGVSRELKNNQKSKNNDEVLQQRNEEKSKKLIDESENNESKKLNAENEIDEQKKLIDENDEQNETENETKKSIENENIFNEIEIENNTAEIIEETRNNETDEPEINKENEISFIEETEYESKLTKIKHCTLDTTETSTNSFPPNNESQVDDISIQSHSTTLNPNENTNNNEQIHSVVEIVRQFLSDKRTKDLILYLNENCDNESTFAAFDCCLNEFPDLYNELCNEGISLDNPVAHHKFALSLIFNEKEEESKFKEARKHLEIAAKKGLGISYFMLARLLHDRYQKDNSAFEAAKQGARIGDKMSLCLLGFFIAHGIGAIKDRAKGVQMMIKSDSKELCDSFATDIGLYYIEQIKNNKIKSNHINKNKNKNDVCCDNNNNSLTINYSDYSYKAFFWFEKAYSIRKTAASINNYGLCFLLGIHVPKNIEKARSIFEEGAKLGDANSLYNLGFIFESTNRSSSIHFYRESASKGHVFARSRLSTLLMKDGQISSESHDFVKCHKIAAEKGSKDSMSILAQNFSRDVEEQENTYNYMVMCAKSGKDSVPLEYAMNLYRMKKFEAAFKYFSIVASNNNPVARFYIGVMKFNGFGCKKDRKESFVILNNLANNEVDRAREFIEDHLNEFNNE